MRSDESSFRLGHSLDAIDRISRYTRGMTFNEFSQDPLTFDAVVRNLEIIGEAARNIPEDVRSQFDQIPWREMLSMRNVLAHGYMSLDVPTIWQTVTEDLPTIRPMLEVMLGQAEQ